jgi:molybdopterin-guanine dinucleotide biosynthesis protein A
MSLSSPATGLILCGGRSSRMGTDKALVELDGRPLLQWVIDALRPLFGEPLLAVGPTERYTDFGVAVVTDVLRDAGPLAGLHAGLRAAPTERVVAVAVDAPLLRPELVRRMLAEAGDADAALPRRADGRWEPLPGVYHRRCLPAIESAVAAGRLRLTGLPDRLTVRAVAESVLREHDPGLLSLINVNTPADRRAVQEAVTRMQAEGGRRSHGDGE